MKNTFILIISSIFFLGLIMNSTGNCSRSERLVNQVLSKTSKMVRHKYNLIPVGSGAAMPGGPIRELCLFFNTKRSLAKKELRKLLILIANDLLSQVNSTNEIQSHIANFPFNEKNVQIIIYNYDENRDDLYDPEISVAEMSQGTLSYLTDDSLKKYSFKNKYTETYEEALNLLSDDKQLSIWYEFMI